MKNIDSPLPSPAAIRVISLFCGCGGLDLGLIGDFVYRGRRYAPTGLSIVAAVDADADACAIYRQNVGPVTRASVESVTDWPAADVVAGGPPCQPYSAAGVKRGAADARDGLPAFLAVLDRVRPPLFVLENVPGLIERRAFSDARDRLFASLDSMDYRVRWAVLDAVDFGVPQRRRRVFLVGEREGAPNAFAFPEPVTADRTLTVRDAIADLHIPVHDRDLRALREGERRHPGFGASSRRLIADAPFPTVKAVDTEENRLIHPWFDRYLTMPELLRAQSFPDSFIVPRRTPCVGNAVPPVLAWHLGRAIARALRAG